MGLNLGHLVVSQMSVIRSLKESLAKLSAKPVLIQKQQDDKVSQVIVQPGVGSWNAPSPMGAVHYQFSEKWHQICYL